MRKTAVTISVALGFCAATAQAGFMSSGWIESARFGYEGTVTRYADADLTTIVDEISISKRDLYLSASNNAQINDIDHAVAMGSWWFSTAVDDQGNPRGAGWGNTHGNTGAGFMQYYNYNDPLSTENGYTSQSQYQFSNFDGTHWTQFDYLLDVSNAAYADTYSRLSAPGNVDDSGLFHSLNVMLTATGLQGSEQGGWIVANGDPASVTGSLSGVFENTTDTNAGFYAFDFALNMDNWAYNNRDLLVGDEPYSQYSESRFAVSVPGPQSVLLLGLGLVGLILVRQRA
ncbi:hypothetical protein HMF8227_00673 [Saliniradius amylolyticus]|uniref:PEP-CTERM protein-sorting domain-containing protein n=1 Tax=Saliniradius amylolyticus TaxID=2183582 RepID=A0A2S2E0Q1_9ALTE|nr:hypothetical protein [Saliniradius amylolyticus]AWL11169.1 hypothetical protein HMF8227_00673 [Saliniradius amylolyticus]